MHHAENKISKISSSLNFSPEKKNVKDSSGAFIGQGNSYLEPKTLPKTKNTKNNEMRL